jgi:thioredoxin 1
MALIHVTDADFEEKVVKSSLPVLVDFWASWCGPCRMLAPALEEIAKKFEGKATVAKIDIDQNPASAGKFGVMSIPTLILFKNGRAGDQSVGFVPAAALSDWLTARL